jgi:hypothetical protein
VAKVVFRRLKATAKAAPGAVGRKRIAKAGGGWKTVHTIDANSATIDTDLHYVFSKNVEKARRENRKAVGLADRAPRKR